ncbi:MAG: hypothetical protein ACRC1Z_23985, partial [Waterburya sp.]
MENTQNNPLIIEQESKNTFQFSAISLFDEENLLETESFGNTLPNVEELAIEILSGEDYQDDSLFPKTIDHLSSATKLKTSQLDSIFSSLEDELTGASVGNTLIGDDHWDRGHETLKANFIPNETILEIDTQGVLYLGLEQAIDSLQKLVASDSFKPIIHSAFGRKTDIASQARQEILGIINGESKIEFELIPETQLGAKGGYSPSNNQIFLANEFLERNYQDLDAVTAVILEEIGHYLDNQFNHADAPGDEGEIFAALALGQKIEPAKLLKIQRENDFAQVKINGQTLEIEQAENISLSNTATTIVGTLSKEPNNLTLGETITFSLLQQDQYKFTLNENSLLYFDSLTNDSNFKWSLTKADGTQVVNQRRFDQSDGALIADPILNLSAGNYLLKVDGSDINSNYSFKLSNLNQAVPLTLGTQINDSFELGKKTDLFKFNATAGERFFFDYQQMTGSAFSVANTRWRLIDPNGAEVFDQAFSTDATDIATSQTGTYTLLIEDYIADSVSSGSAINYRFQVEKLNQPVNLTLGETITNKLTQKDYRFTLNENSLLYFDSLTNDSNFKWSLTKADGTQVVNQRRFDQSDG